MVLLNGKGTVVEFLVEISIKTSKDFNTRSLDVVHKGRLGS